jgi:septal ring factor EnvC (AmiA/AmiB activator)
MEAEHRQLKELYERKAHFQDAAIAAQNAAEAQVARLAAEAQDLRDLMQRIEEDRQRRVAEAEARAAAEKAAREAEIAARRAAEEAEAVAFKAKQEAEQAALRAAREQKERERLVAEAAKEAERRALADAKEKQVAAQRAAQASQKATREADASRPQSQNRQSFEDAKGKILFPARGRIIESYNPNAEIGVGKRGITIQTRADAQVVAPYDGQVVFAESFRGYGLLLIIEHSDGYHTLIAGMTRIDAVVGQKLLAGEPVGVMGSEESKPALYVELRHNGQPINPTPWLTAHTSLKVHG